jgi:hypothetical protein
MRPIKMMTGGHSGGGGYNAETVAWYTAIAGLGASVTTTEKNWADALIVAWRAQTFDSKTVSIYPFLGAYINAARVPLRDALSAGPAANTGFVDGDVGNAVGIANSSGANKYLNTGITPSQLGSSGNGGLGWYERNFLGNGTTTEIMGMDESTITADGRFVLDIRSSGNRFFSFGEVGTRSGDTVAGANGFYYGQRNGATSRALYKDSTQLGSTNTSSDPASGANQYSILLMGCNVHGTPTQANGRGGIAVLTDGTFTTTEIGDMKTLIDIYLITATGR